MCARLLYVRWCSGVLKKKVVEGHTVLEDIWGVWCSSRHWGHVSISRYNYCHLNLFLAQKKRKEKKRTGRRKGIARSDPCVLADKSITSAHELWAIYYSVRWISTSNLRLKKKKKKKKKLSTPGQRRAKHDNKISSIPRDSCQGQPRDNYTRAHFSVGPWIMSDGFVCPSFFWTFF